MYKGYIDYKCKIFGEKFVENNENNINLRINNEEIKLVSETEFKKGENKIPLIIKNDL